MKEYDIVIVGGGPAGLTAGLYAARARRKTVVLERMGTGGQAALADLVENYPGFPDGIKGFELGQAMERQAKRYGTELHYVEATGLERRGDMHLVKTAEEDYLAKAVILTCGVEQNRLGVAGEAELTGKGVSYCATCDAAFFKGEVCAVVGAGDAGLSEGIFVTRYASKVYVVSDVVLASEIVRERAFANPKMHFILDHVVSEVLGQDKVEGLRLKNLTTAEESILEVAGVFVFIGWHPGTDFLKGCLKMDEGGYIYVNHWMETEIPGLFAAGDVRVDSGRQLITAAGDGATAAMRADHYISDHFAAK
jgi:thioredoxin reductase (NADPH)